MGLDIRLGRPDGYHPSDPAPSWPYIAFSSFRTRLAALDGVQLDRMEGFRPYPPEQHQDWVGIPWSEVDTPLKPLLNHSDCDGELTPQEAAALAPALEGALDRLDPDDWTQARDIQIGRELVQLLTIAAAEQITVQFR